MRWCRKGYDVVGQNGNWDMGLYEVGDDEVRIWDYMRLWRMGSDRVGIWDKMRW